MLRALLTRGTWDVCSHQAAGDDWIWVSSTGEGGFLLGIITEILWHPLEVKQSGCTRKMKN